MTDFRDMTPELMDLIAEWIPTPDPPRKTTMWLSTVGETGTPDIRAVLLTDYTVSGFAFTTMALTRKVADLRANSRAALAFLALDPLRQLTVQGSAEECTAEESAKAFHEKSRSGQLRAWFNTHEHARLDEKARERAWIAFAKAHPDGSLEPPEGWTAYRVRPDRLTFWSESAHGSHRVEFSLASGEWVRSVLSG